MFTVAGNILWTYVLPGIPPLALWTARWLERREVFARRALLIGTACANLILVAALALAAFTGLADRGSAAGIVRLYQSQLQPEAPLVFWGTAPHSAAFYTSGRALEVRDTSQLATIQPGSAAFVAIRKTDRGSGGKCRAAAELQTIDEVGEFRLLLRSPTSGTAYAAAAPTDSQATPERTFAQFLAEIVNLALHVDVHLSEFVAQYGAWVYALVFAIVFVETGLVVMPFLPGVRCCLSWALLVRPQPCTCPLAIALPPSSAAVLGDQLNFVVGRAVGQRAFAWKQSVIFNRRAFDKTHAFYEKYGGITIVFARFLPFVRTFAPFVAGIAEMNRSRFTRYNVLGAALWTASLVLAGFLLGNVPWSSET